MAPPTQEEFGKKYNEIVGLWIKTRNNLRKIKNKKREDIVNKYEPLVQQNITRYNRFNKMKFDTREKAMLHFLDKMEKIVNNAVAAKKELTQRGGRWLFSHKSRKKKRKRTKKKRRRKKKKTRKRRRKRRR